MICFETAMVRSRWTRRYCSVSPKEDADAESYGGEDCWGTRIAEFGTMEFRGSTRGGAIKSYQRQSYEHVDAVAPKLIASA